MMAAEDWVGDWDDWDGWGEGQEGQEERARKSLKQGRKGAMQRRGNSRSRSFVEVGDVEVFAESPRAIKVRFEDGRERWIPISQTPQGFEWEVGKTVALEVSEWLTEQDDWDAEPEADPDHQVPDVVCLKETAKAIEVRAGRGDPVWVPKSHVRKTSEVQGDGDRGVLTISLWIAEQKNLVEGREPQGPSVADDVRGQRRGGGGGGFDPRQETFDAHFVGDDDIPFIRYWP